jgi:hypothetical protein
MLETSKSEDICWRGITMKKCTQMQMDCTRPIVVGRETILLRRTRIRISQSTRRFIGKLSGVPHKSRALVIKETERQIPAYEEISLIVLVIGHRALSCAASAGR